MADLSGKTALITAAGQGIGRASAVRFAAAGATVVATDINDAALESLKGEHASIGTHRLDVRSGDAVNKLMKDFGRVDILFNCAGYVSEGSILDCEEKDWNVSFDLNVTSMYRTVQSCSSGHACSGFGRNREYVVGRFELERRAESLRLWNDQSCCYRSYKAIAADFVSKGIRCNALCPGTVDTPSLTQRIAAQGDYETIRACFIARQPMGRLGRAAEIAAAALFLASDESSFMTGQALAIDGGWSI